MKKLLGTDIPGSWTFSPDGAGAGTIVFNGVALDLRQILLINNATRNTIIYNFADAAAGAATYAKLSATSSELTLAFDTSLQDLTDDLTIYVDVDEPVMVDAAPQGVLANLILRVYKMLAAPLGYSKDIQRYRNTAIIESGTVTTVSTVTTANVATISGLAAERLVYSTSRSAWAASHRARIT
jgi:hypothetical protein